MTSMTATRPPLELPRRIRCADPDKGSLECGHEPWHLKVSRSWAAYTVRSAPSAVHPLLLSLSELHTNALRHSASGLPGGRVRIEIERRRRLLLLRVTDAGPRPGAVITLPQALPLPGDCPLREGGYGLALVDAMALYWDFTREPNGAMTVRAAFDRSGRIRVVT